MINNLAYRTQIIMLLSLVMLSSGVSAQSQYRAMSDKDRFSVDMQNSAKSTKSIACQFVQERGIAMMTKPILSKGSFWFKKPSSVRWEYSEPYEHLIILSKRKVFVKDAGTDKEYDTGANSMFKNMGEIMFSFILGDISKAENNYNVEYLESDKEFYIKLRPKTADVDANLELIELFFDKNDFSLNAIKMNETGGDYTRISFENKKINTNISNAMFLFK